jgi:hypothetical protein
MPVNWPCGDTGAAVGILRKLIAYEAGATPIPYSSVPVVHNAYSVGAVDVHSSLEAFEEAGEWQANDMQWQEMMNIDYLAEVEAGDVIYMQGAIVSAAGRKLTCRWKLYDQATNKQSMDATVLYVCMDLDTRRSRDIPRHLLASKREAATAAEG